MRIAGDVGDPLHAYRITGAMVTLHVLFICGKNRLRSPTAEQLFADRPGIETASAGISNDADNPVGAELIAWADLIFVMEKTHRTKLSRRFKSQLNNQRVICLNIPDRYAFMDEQLIRLLEARVSPHLPSATP